MRRTLFTLTWCCACAVVSAATVYKWVDENGVTHYSDQPHQNAAKVEVQQPQTYSSPHVAEPTQSAPATPAKSAPAYTSCEIDSPAQDQTFANTYSLAMTVNLLPEQRPGDKVIFVLDGQPVNGSGGPPVFSLPQVDRGTHTVQATVKSADGQVICQSTPVTFHVHQPSVQSPVRPR